MKLTIKILPFLTIFIISCKKDVKKSFVDKINPKDTICLNEVKKANNDLNKNKLVYCHYIGNIIRNDLRSENEMKSLLKNYNIELQNETSPCVINPNTNYHCYCELMEEKINEKYGKKLIPSLLYKSDSLWVLKNLDKTFETGGIYGTWDKCALFPNDKFYNETNHSGLQEYFEKKVEYPNNYRTKSHDYSNATIDAKVYVDRNGKAKVEEISANFYDYKTNEKDYNVETGKKFTNLAKQIIEETKWTPAKIKNINVNSKMDLWITLQ